MQMFVIFRRKFAVKISQLYMDEVYTSLRVFQSHESVKVFLPSFLHLFLLSSTFVSLRVMRKCLQRLWEWSFISKDQSHHAAPCATNTHQYKHTHTVHTLTGFISKDQRHHAVSYTYINTYTRRQASSAKSHHIVSHARTHRKQEQRKGGVEGEDKRE